MSVKPENQFRTGIHKYLPVELHHEKMNNPYGSGTADDWYSGNKSDIWIEYKFLPRIPQRGDIWLCNTNVKQPMLSKLQQKWLHDRHVEGRKVYVIVGCSSGGVIMSSLNWEKPMAVDEFTQRIATRKELAGWIARETMR
jgi:hypothetical protein